MKLEQLTFDAQGTPQYGLDAAGNVWRLDLNRDADGRVILVAFDLPVVTIQEYAAKKESP